VRIVAGEWGGRRLAAPAGRDVRPTGERVREALFSILGEAVTGARVLDLCAGSGALGLEALSRGAASATLVDAAPAAARAAEENVRRLGATGAQVHRGDARRFLADAARAGRQYDLVFLDPPYRDAATLGRDLGEALGPVLAPGARVVTESDRRAPLPLPWPPDDERRYGDTLIRIHIPT
jgi:16S rRNA (guanine966-N2)-methyltransferase